MKKEYTYTFFELHNACLKKAGGPHQQASFQYFANKCKIKLEDHTSPRGWFGSNVRITAELYNYMYNNVEKIIDYELDLKGRKLMPYLHKYKEVETNNLKYGPKKLRQYLQNETNNLKSKFFIRKGSTGFDKSKKKSHHTIDYNDVKDNIPSKEKTTNKIPIIGYEDVKDYIIEQLEPIINPEESEAWGLKKPGGILLFGPPGCGKTYWATWIGNFLNYKFKEIPRSIFGSIYVDGAMTKLSEILILQNCLKKG